MTKKPNASAPAPAEVAPVLSEAEQLAILNRTLIGYVGLCDNLCRLARGEQSRGNFGWDEAHRTAEAERAAALLVMLRSKEDENKAIESLAERISTRTPLVGIGGSYGPSFHVAAMNLFYKVAGIAVTPWQAAAAMLSEREPINFEQVVGELRDEFKRFTAATPKAESTPLPPPPPKPTVPVYSNGADGPQLLMLDGTIVLLTEKQAKVIEVLIDHGPLGKERLDDFAATRPVSVGSPLKLLRNLVRTRELQEWIVSNPGAIGIGYSTTIIHKT